jgi:hypothetical protein
MPSSELQYPLKDETGPANLIFVTMSNVINKCFVFVSSDFLNECKEKGRKNSHLNEKKDLQCLLKILRKLKRHIL